MQSTHLLCPNCEKNHFMLKKLRLIPMIVSAVTVMLCCLVPQSAHATLYSYVTVKTDNPDAGLVSVVESGKKVGTYAAEQQKTQSAWQLAGRPSSATHNYDLYAKVNDGYIFVGWMEGSKLVSTENPFTVGKTTYTTTSPGTGAVYTAHFIPKPAATATVSLPYGAPKITPDENKVGDVVTLSYTLPTLPKYPHVKNVMLEFSHWEDDMGNVLSHEPTFSYTIDREMQFVACLKELGGIPEVGKYYRVRCFSNRVLTLEGGYKFSMPLAGGKTVDPELLRWALPTDFNPADFNTNGSLTNLAYPRTDTISPICPEASPNTIFYISQGNKAENGLKKVVLEGQGVNTKTLTSNNTLDIVRMNNSFYGYFGFQSSAVSKAGLKMTFNNNGCDVYLGSYGEEDPYSAMAVQPIDEEHMDYFWFGAAPAESMLFDGGYWTSMYTAFPYECRDGVEAYYVTELATANGETYAVLTRVDGDRVPAKAAVLLKCQGLDTKQNRLLPLHPSENIAALSNNVLKGEFQLYTNNKKEGRKLYDPAKMLVLNVDSDGEVGFFRLAKNTDGTERELAANKAYLDMTAFSANVKSLKLIREEDTAGLDLIIPEMETVGTPTPADNAIYNLFGQRVLHPVSGQIYIVDGKKIIF